jgi:hypothetical protein
VYVTGVLSPWQLYSVFSGSKHWAQRTCHSVTKADENWYLGYALKISWTASVFQWSEFLATDPEALVRFPALPEEEVVGLERGPLSLVSTTEELLDRKVAATV